MLTCRHKSLRNIFFKERLFWTTLVCKDWNGFTRWLKKEGLVKWKVKIAEPTIKGYFDVLLHRGALVLMIAQRACLLCIFPRVFSQTKCRNFWGTGFGFAGKYAEGVDFHGGADHVRKDFPYLILCVPASASMDYYGCLALGRIWLWWRAFTLIVDPLL